MQKDEVLRERIRKVVSNRNANRTSGRFDTSDIIQETELQLWRNGLVSYDCENKSLESTQPAKKIDQPLLATIAKGHLSKFLRRHTAKKRDAHLENASAEYALSDDRNPSEEIESREESEFLLRAVNQLEEAERVILFYRFFCDLTFAEMETVTEFSKQVLRTRYNKAIANLKLILEHLQSDTHE